MDPAEEARRLIELEADLAAGWRYAPAHHEWALRAGYTAEDAATGAVAWTPAGARRLAAARAAVGAR